MPRQTPFRYPLEIRLHDTDAAGVLFYGHLFRHAHDAYESFMAHHGWPLHRLIAEGTALPITESGARFLAPIRHGDALVCELRVREVRRRSFSLEYRFIDENNGLRAEAWTLHVLLGDALPVPLGDALKGAGDPHP